MIRVIVAEDEPAAMNYIVTLLNKYPGIKIVAQAEDGIEALEALKNYSADILITDIQMPRLNGIELATKAREAFPNILTLIVSGFSDFEFAKEAIRVGVVDYLLKPFTPAQFETAIREMSVLVKKNYRKEKENWLRQAVSQYKNNQSFPGNCNSHILFGVILTGAGVKIPVDDFAYPQLASEELAAIYIHNKSEICFVYPCNQHKKAKEIADMLSFNAPFYTATYVIKAPEEGALVLYNMLKAVKMSAVCGDTVIFEYSPLNLNEDGSTEKELSLIKNINYEITASNTEKIKALFVDLFAIWEQNKKTIAQLEVTLTRLVQFMADNAPPGHNLTHNKIAEAIPQICRESLSYLDILGKTWALCAKFYEPLERMSESGQLIHNIVSYIKDHLNEPLSAQGICAVFNISNSHLYRIFRKHIKMTMVEYITELRIEEAKLMFASDANAQVKDVAAKLGFSDQFYFSKVFRAITGKSPSEYKKKL